MGEGETYPELTTKEFRNLLNSCVHCGLCLQACPTYSLYGTEMDSPRGRIRLMLAAANGRISAEELSKSFKQHIELCLSCLSCQSACPSNVRYDKLIETVKYAIMRHRKQSLFERFVRWLSFKQMMPYANRLKLMARIFCLYEISGLQRLVRTLNILPSYLKAMESILPPITPKYYDYSKPAKCIGEKRGTVAFFIGCVQEAFLSSVNIATIRVLQRNGFDVHFPKGQTCCAAAHIHMGEWELAKSLARKNIDAFEDYDVIISNAGGCGATLKTEYTKLFHDDPTYLKKAETFQSKVKDICEFLAENLYVPPRGRINVKATYSDSCHLRHVQNVSKQPRDLLRQIPGLELIELRSPDHCCGSAGVYNIIQFPTADGILDMKMSDIAGTSANLIVTSNPGCQMQLWAGVRRANIKAIVMHVVEVIDASYRIMDGEKAVLKGLSND